MAHYNDMASLNKAILEHARNSMKDEVAPVIKDAVSDQVESVVYDRYKTAIGKPYVYERRGTSTGSGGIGDTDVMFTQINDFSKGFSMSIKNMAKGQNDNMFIADLVEGGQGHNGKNYKYTVNRETNTPSYLEPRPFQAKAAEELKRSEEHLNTFLKSMRRKGIDIRKL